MHKQNGPGGVAAPTGAEKNKTAAQDARSSVTVPAQRGSRHVTGQTPLARFMLVHERHPRRRQADAIPLDACPVCGYQSKHNTEWPPPETMWKSCTACGFRDEFAVIEIKAGSRTRRAAR